MHPNENWAQRFFLIKSIRSDCSVNLVIYFVYSLDRLSKQLPHCPFFPICFNNHLNLVRTKKKTQINYLRFH